MGLFSSKELNQAQSQYPTQYNVATDVGSYGFGPQGAYSKASPLISGVYNQTMQGLGDFDRLSQQKRDEAYNAYYQPFLGQANRKIGDYFGYLDGSMRGNSKGQAAIGSFASSTARNLGRDMLDVGNQQEQLLLDQLVRRNQQAYQPISGLMAGANSMANQDMQARIGRAGILGDKQKRKSGIWGSLGKAAVAAGMGFLKGGPVGALAGAGMSIGGDILSRGSNGGDSGGGGMFSQAMGNGGFSSPVGVDVNPAYTPSPTGLFSSSLGDLRNLYS